MDFISSDIGRQIHSFPPHPFPTIAQMLPRIYHSHEYVPPLIYKYLLAASVGKEHPRELASSVHRGKSSFRKNSRETPPPDESHDFACAYTNLRGRAFILSAYRTVLVRHRLRKQADEYELV